MACGLLCDANAVDGRLHITLQNERQHSRFSGIKPVEFH
ncbi:hypothetical protein RBWH47_00946 [Rhodopirellula baltica WH47]|nr:hypothetical protein RBWH47_00946 [Rhodopirellula baltica WH47]ELP30878.1 hypothetical protein RBSWK_05144 [Rhodopirellula baltica SWK14]